MNATRQVSLTGPFDAEPAGNGLWLLRQRAPGQALLVLRGFLPPAGFGACTALGLDWPAAGGVVVTVELPSGPVRVTAEAATVHEPRPEVYGAVPLASYDSAQARFWQRVFRIVRLPGGRLLLAWLAGRSRRSRRIAT